MMGWYSYNSPNPTVVVKDSPPTRPFGFSQNTGIKWQPVEPERHVRDEAMQEFCEDARKRG